MKILQLTKHYPPYPGGIETVTYDITEGLHSRGFSVEVLCSNNRLKNEDDWFQNKYLVRRSASFGKLFSTSLSLHLISTLKKMGDRFDVIHVHFPDPLTALAIYLCAPKSKIVVHWHSDIIKQKRILKVFLPLQNWMLKRADKIIGTSPVYVNESEQLKLFRHKCSIIPIGIHKLKHGRPNEREVSDIKESYPGKKIIFSLGRMVYYKGFKYLVEAAKYVSDDAVILIGGSGPLFEEIQSSVVKSGLEKKVRLLGRIEDRCLPNFFSACDIFCFPSIEKSEAFGVVQIEAMSYGKPVVATNIPASGVSWVNKDGVSGFNVPIRNSLALAEKLNLLINNDILYKKMSRQAQERYAANFTRDSMVDQIVDLYNSL